MRKRQLRAKKRHFALLVNKAAAGYSRQAVGKLLGAIKRSNSAYTIYEPESALDMLRQAEVATGKRRASQKLSAPYSGGGPVTALIACGGDGSFNLVARAALKGGLPVGVIPMGRLNNLARSYLGSVDTDAAIKKIVAGSISLVDSATASGLPFFGSAGFGFVTSLAGTIEQDGPPRFAMGWAKTGSRAAAEVSLKRTVIKVDSFRFEVKPIIFNVNLVTYSAGLPISPASDPGDGCAEIIFDHEANIGNFTSYTRLIFKRKYLYGDDVRLYRGRVIICQPVKGRQLYIDGELIEMPSEVLEIKIGPEKLSVLC